MSGVLTRCRVPAPFCTHVLGEHLGERIDKVLTRASEVREASPTVDLAPPMASVN